MVLLAISPPHGIDLVEPELKLVAADVFDGLDGLAVETPEVRGVAQD
jgi:hypothetical protein